MQVWKIAVLALFALVAAFAIGIGVSFGRDARAREQALASQARMSPTRSGALQYALAGQGDPVLVIHGAGGGFDQGLLIADAFVGAGHRIIAPSRFGYLGSALPPDPSTSAQADAFADLLDALALERVSVVGFSGGAPPALQFSLRYPERTRCLALLSPAPFTPYRPPPSSRPIPAWLYQSLFGSDLLYWALAKANPGLLLQAFDARTDLRGNLVDDENLMLEALLEGFLPASARVDGVLNEAAAIDPDASYGLETISAPVLVIHARDDRINSFAVAEAIADRTHNARLLALERGGHLLLGAHADVRLRMREFLNACPM